MPPKRKMLSISKLNDNLIEILVSRCLRVDTSYADVRVCCPKGKILN